MDMVEGFWDRSAPYGPNGYSYGTGAWVDAPAVRAIQFKMVPGDQCISRGVMETRDGSVYVWSVRSERHADISGHRRLATLMRSGTFEEHARNLLAAEESRIDPDLLDLARRQVAVLNEIKSSADTHPRKWSAVHYGHSRPACGATLRADDLCTEAIGDVRCMDCLEAIHRTV